ncbi:hypothetical protein LTR56_024893 [Elasticomyces elasticus]|nr:hypothetical protein LTR56_024893 [Elasticomyces elasticus]KAK3620182.1 hypothetical protein LTR22_025696 [Elasticomyces elasticus]
MLYDYAALGEVHLLRRPNRGVATDAGEGCVGAAADAFGTGEWGDGAKWGNLTQIADPLRLFRRIRLLPVFPSIRSAVNTPTINTTINCYLQASQGGGDTVIYPGTAYDKLRKHDGRRVQVHDIRGREAEFDLDTHGFQLVQHQSAEEISEDELKMEAGVYAEPAELLQMV